MKEIAATIFALALGYAVVRGENPATNAVPEGVKHPTQAGSYVMGEWTYVYGVKAKGSQSERRNGTLLRQGFLVPGRVGEVIDTPFGRFVFLDDSYDSGWLRTATYDHPLFDEKGDLLSDIRNRLTTVRGLVTNEKGTALDHVAVRVTHCTTTASLRHSILRGGIEDCYL